ncbi:hypothetical protein EDC19_1957 [Natranaerovirga hydrolytica]|uniref:Uncharacterized protein n=1 Tax=Natranaerovirga hydrolytica TaxID=680378 RepID=A0A4R1MLR1_9FIRM|nr:hypothetical protein [Natranaerovirga hydrolytica]TCK92802.1 hypothetical protein EDC19_1957 [Natranaerovirga hydrolytica]
MIFNFKRKLNILVFICITLMIIVSIFFFTQIDNTSHHKGVYTDFLTSKITNDNINLEIRSFNIDENKLNFEGTIYGDEDRYPFNIQGDLYQSHLNSNDILIDVNNQNSTIDHLDVVQWKLIKSADISDLNVDSSLLNQKAMVLKFYHPEDKSYFSFDIDLTDYYDGEINGDTLDLSNDVIDLWHYQIKYIRATSSNTNNQDSHSYNDKDVIPSSKNTYDIIIEEPTNFSNNTYKKHVISIHLGIDGNKRIEQQRTLNTSIEVIDYNSYIVNVDDGTLKKSKTSIDTFSLGHIDDPININHYFKKSFANHLNWYGNNFKSTDFKDTRVYLENINYRNIYKTTFENIQLSQPKSLLRTLTTLVYEEESNNNFYIAEFYIPIYLNNEKQGMFIETIQFDYKNATQS